MLVGRAVTGLRRAFAAVAVTPREGVPVRWRVVGVAVGRGFVAVTPCDVRVYVLGAVACSHAVGDV